MFHEDIHTPFIVRLKYHMQLANLSFDEMLDLAAEVSLYFCLLKSSCSRFSTFGFGNVHTHQAISISIYLCYSFFVNCFFSTVSYYWNSPCILLCTGHYNHCLFWNTLCNHASSGAPSGKVCASILCQY